MASAAAPPTIGNTNTGTSSQSPRSPTARVDLVMSYTMNGTATATISSPNSEIDRPMNNRRKSRRHAQRRDVDQVLADARHQPTRDLGLGIGSQMIGHDGRPR